MEAFSFGETCGEREIFVIHAHTLRRIRSLFNCDAHILNCGICVIESKIIKLYIINNEERNRILRIHKKLVENNLISQPLDFIREGNSPIRFNFSNGTIEYNEAFAPPKNEYCIMLFLLHEAGHEKLHQLRFTGLKLILISYAVAFVASQDLRTFIVSSSYLIRPLIVISILITIYVVFALLSRIDERNADIFSAKKLHQMGVNQPSLILEELFDHFDNVTKQPPFIGQGVSEKIAIINRRFSHPNRKSRIRVMRKQCDQPTKKDVKYIDS